MEATLYVYPMAANGLYVSPMAPNGHGSKGPPASQAFSLAKAFPRWEIWF